jgi:ParB family chromosome partitioning protein
MTKKNDFDNLDLDSDFAARPLVQFTRDEDPKDIGKRRANNAAIIRLSQIIAKDQVREDFDENEHRKLVASIKEHGQQQPIKVRWSQEDERWVILMGERRYRACKDAGLEEIQCTIADENLTEAEIVELQIVENIHRKALNPVEEAKSYKQLMDFHNCTAQDVAKRLKVAPTTVQRTVRLLKLPEDILEQVAAGKLTKTLIREVQKIKDPNEQRKLIEDYKSGGHTAVVEKVQDKRTEQGTNRSKKPLKRSQTINGIKLQATAKTKATKAEIAEALRAWADDLDSDGRSRRKVA